MLSAAILCCAFLLLGSCASFQGSGSSERIQYFSFDPDVRVAVNSESDADLSKPTLLIIYALPNGNSIEMTAGKNMTPGLDWHYDIQHIAAQTRFLRREMNNTNIVTAYLETKEKSWPAWRRKRISSEADIARIVDLLRFETGQPRSVAIAGHSGGGSFISGFIDAYDTIPKYVDRICYLDANYSYNDSLDHGKKIYQWLRNDTAKKLVVIAYDDREIVYEGKKIIGPSGGTFRATQRMLQRFVQLDTVTASADSTIVRSRSVNDQAHFIVHANPLNAILHTVLVERNGFIHSMLLNTDAEEKKYTFFGERAYRQLIRED
jgi:hypothetical protein